MLKSSPQSHGGQWLHLTTMAMAGQLKSEFTKKHHEMKVWPLDIPPKEVMAMCAL